MFDLTYIYSEENRSFTCTAILKDSAKAEEIRKAFIGPVRQINLFLDLYPQGNILFLESPDKDTLLKAADILNHSVDWK